MYSLYVSGRADVLVY